MNKTQMRRCKNFNCDKMRGHYCCTDCDQRKSCANPCLNHPTRCGLSEAPPVRLGPDGKGVAKAGPPSKHTPGGPKEKNNRTPAL